MPAKKKELTLEQAMEQLESMAREMEAPDLSIDKMMEYYEKSQALVARQIPISKLMRLGLFDKLVKMKYDIPNDQLEKFEEYEAEIDQKTSELLRN